MSGPTREHVQNAARVAAFAFVLLWILSPSLQGLVPFWLPFAVLLGMEVEFVVGGLRERRSGAPVRSDERRLPGDADADLGWVETVDEDGDPVLVPAAPRARHRSRLPLAVVLLVGLGLFAYAYRVDRESGWGAIPAAEQRRAESRFAAEAGRIAGKPVRLVCDSGYVFTGVGSDAAGVAFIPRGLTYIEPSVCRELYRIAFEDRLGSRDAAAFAIAVLAHEATHLRGMRDEAVTECYALQEGVRLGERLGLDAGTARALMRAQLDRDLSDATIQRVDYRLPPGCRDGGRLDLRPADPSFP